MKNKTVGLWALGSGLLGSGLLGAGLSSAGLSSAKRPAPSAYLQSGRRVARTALLLCVAACVAGCRQDMHDAPRYDPLEASTILPKGSSAQPLVTGTMPRGFLREDDHLYAGKVNGQPATTFPFEITRADLDRGEERFNIYCSPCHGRTGEGNGMVVQRGFRQAANYHIDRLREAPIGYFYDVMTNGFGAMPDYRMQIPAEDRWRIVAYVRALQLSHHARTTDVPPDQLKKLIEGGTAAPAGGRQ